MKRYAILAAFAVVGCDYIPGTDAHRIIEAQDGIARNLRDPASGQFRDGFVGKKNTKGDGPKDAVCGQVNAKNGMGGYVGFKRFVYADKGEIAIVDPDHNGLEQRIAGARQLCYSGPRAACHLEDSLRQQQSEQVSFNETWADYCSYPPK